MPIKRNTSVGKIEVLYKNKVVSRGDLVVSEDIEKLNFIELLRESLLNIVFGKL